jgi:hypothetical protein
MSFPKSEIDLKRIGYRFGKDCKAQDWSPETQRPPVFSSNPLVLAMRYITMLPYHAYMLYGGIIGVLLIPFNFVGVLILLIFKLILNPPGTSCVQSTLVWEFDVPASVDPTDVLGDIKRYYTLGGKRPGVQTDVGISKEFFVERFNYYWWLPLPLMFGQMAFDEEKQEIALVWKWWCPHFVTGRGVIKQNPDNNCLVVCGEVRHWYGLTWFYKYSIGSIVGLYHKQILRLKASLHGTPEYDMVVIFPKEKRAMEPATSV